MCEKTATWDVVGTRGVVDDDRVTQYFIKFVDIGGHIIFVSIPIFLGCL